MSCPLKYATARFLTCCVNKSALCMVRRCSCTSAKSGKLGGVTTVVSRFRPPLFVRFHLCGGQNRGHSVARCTVAKRRHGTTNSAARQRRHFWAGSCVLRVKASAPGRVVVDGVILCLLR